MKNRFNLVSGLFVLSVIVLSIIMFPDPQPWPLHRYLLLGINIGLVGLNLFIFVRRNRQGTRRHVPLRIRLKLAWRAFNLKEATLSWGRTVHQNTPSQPAYCDYPLHTAYYNKAKVRCGEPVTECIGRRRIWLQVSDDGEDIEYCRKHQEQLRRERGEDGKSLRCRLGLHPWTIPVWKTVDVITGTPREVYMPKTCKLCGTGGQQEGYV